MQAKKKKVAAIATEYRKWSHADVILTKLLRGYNHDGGRGPNMELVSLYVDQFPKSDMSRKLARQFGFKIFDTIEGAITLGQNRVAVDGVLSIGEHGTYPANTRGQRLYPRRRFFTEIANTFEKYKRVVPVFNDKHLAATWEDAKWMYDRARELYIPFLAGSSLPLTWRKPPLQIARNSRLQSALAFGFSDLEAYGYHALETLQCMVERRHGGETGVKAVQCLQGDDIWKSLDQGRWSKELLDALLPLVTAHAATPFRQTVAKSAQGAVFLIEYRDGLQAAVAMLGEWVHEFDGESFFFAAKLEGRTEPVKTHFYLQQPYPFAHFIKLLEAIESMFQTGHPPYPVERTLLTTGMLDGLMISKAEKHRRVETPYLDIRYQPTDWPFATGPIPKAVEG